MKIAVFDTETTGLPKTKTINEPSLHLWPYIVQFSYIIYDTELKKITKTVDLVIKIPENIDISDEVSDIHGITNFISQTSQYKIEDALKAGHRLFGENKIQDGIKRWSKLLDVHKDIKLHYIGHLQTNKVKKASAVPPLLYPIKIIVCVEEAPGNNWQKALYSISSSLEPSFRFSPKRYCIRPK